MKQGQFLIVLTFFYLAVVLCFKVFPLYAQQHSVTKLSGKSIIKYSLSIPEESLKGKLTVEVKAEEKEIKEIKEIKKQKRKKRKKEKSSSKNLKVAIEVNKASFKELIQVPGIGPKMAKRIIAFREEIGGQFSNWQELFKIKGIGKKKLQKWSKYLLLNGKPFKENEPKKLRVLLKKKNNSFQAKKNTKKTNIGIKRVKSGRNLVNINKASLVELTKLPRIGKKTAQRIIDYRHKHLFKRKEDIMKVKGIGKATYQKLKDLITVSP